MKLKVDATEAEKIKRGTNPLLLEKLRELDRDLVKLLKVRKDDLLYFQGASKIVDNLIEILE